MRVFVSESEFSEASGIPCASLRTKRARGSGPPYYKVGSKVLYRLDEALGWVDSHRICSASDTPQRLVRAAARGGSRASAGSKT